MVLFNIASRIMQTQDYSLIYLWGSKLYLNLIYMWPDGRRSRLQKISVFIMASLIFNVFVGMLLYLLKNIDDFNKATFIIGFMVISTMCGGALFFICYKYNDCKKLVDSIMVNYWPYDIINEENIGYTMDAFNYSNVIIIYVSATGILFTAAIVVIPLFSNERILPFPSEYPFDWTAFPLYEIIYSLQMAYIMVSGIILVAGVDLLIMGLLLSTANQFNILRNCFLAFNTDRMINVNKKLRKLQSDQLECKYDEQREYFIRCVRHHCMLLRTIKTINDVLNPLNMIHLVLSVFGFCLGFLRVSNLENSSNIEVGSTFICIIGYMIQLAIGCFFGTELYYQASLLPDAIFQSNWVHLENKQLKKDFMFVIQHAQRIPQFNAYNLYDMNMMSFLKVLKLAFSFYTVLSSIGNKK